MKPSLNIALVSAADPQDRRTWSGSTFFMASALKRHVGRVDYIGPMSIPGQKIKEMLARWIQRVSGIRTYPFRTIAAAEYFAGEVSRRLAGRSYDLIFAPAASVEIARLETNIPIVYVSDATFSLMQEVYPIFSSMAAKSAAAEDFFERSVQAKARLLLYPSQWAAASALADYGTVEEKVRIIPFGANIDRDPERRAVIGKEITDTIKILFLAKEWARKGGSIAVDTLESLTQMGIDAEMTVCGVRPPAGVGHPRMTVIPYLDKNVPQDRQRFEQLLSESHVLLLPTRIECYGIVFCEANAYGLPVFATRVGGIPTIVKDGQNGYLMPLAADGRAFAEQIAKAVSDRDHYRSLNLGARERYEQVLNWDAWGRAVRTAVRDTLGI